MRDDISDLLKVNQFFFFEFFLLILVILGFFTAFFVITFLVFFIIILIHSCNPIYIVEDNSMSVLKLETLKALRITGHADFYGLCDNVSKRYLVDDDVLTNEFTTFEVHKVISSLLIVCRTQIDRSNILVTSELVFIVPDWPVHI